MLAKRIIPCLDVTDGRVVKGINFVDLQDAGDPAELAQTYSQEGADELVFLDISATTEGRNTVLDWVQRVATEVAIPLTVGGGIREVNDIGAILRAGADKISINTRAVAEPELVRQASDRFGAQCIVVAIDAARSSDGSYEIRTHGGRCCTGIDAVDWARQVCQLGAGELLVTSVDRDGTTAGYDVPLIRRLNEVVSVPIIASGGAGTPGDMVEALRCGADAVLAASIFHYGRYSISEVKEYIAKQGEVVRL